MKFCCVISHTHWDREWYLPFESMRLRLVDLVDNLLELLEREPDYIFHLDAQTVVLEDYLEIRPQNKARLEAYIAQGRILVGPWYVQNDFFLTAGESTVRNLLIGTDMAAQFGGDTRCGYAPDQFGNIAQLPQILMGFGIDHFIFGRGFRHFDPEREPIVPNTAEFEWKGADGTPVLAVCMRFWYNNAQRFSQKPEIARAQFVRMTENLAPFVTAPCYLLMNGVDHLEAQENLLPILKNLQRDFPEDVIRQSTLPEYVETLRRLHREGDTKLPVYQGELRFGNDYQVLSGTLSSRAYIKQRNDDCEEKLYHMIEPLYAMLSVQGGRGLYPADTIRHVLKKILQNHAHDSICGCSADAVSRHMLDRYACAAEIEDGLLDRGLRLICDHVDFNSAKTEDFTVTVVNTLPFARTQVLQARLTFPMPDRVKAFTLTDDRHREVPYEVVEKGRRIIKILDPINLPRSLETDSYTIEFIAGDVPPMGVRSYIVKKCPAAPGAQAADAAPDDTLENEYLRVTAGGDGRIDIEDKQNGRVVRDALWLEDTADYGSSYIFMPGGEKAVSSRDFPCNRKKLPGSAYMQRLEMAIPMKLPEKIGDRKTHRRSGRAVLNPVTLTLSLERGSKTLDVAYSVRNASMDHRLRAVVRTGIETDETRSLVPFDLSRRRRGGHYVPDVRTADEPNSGLIALSGEAGTVGLFNRGLYEYEHLERPGGQVALTVLRATGVISIQKGVEKVRLGEDWIVPENQCVGGWQTRGKLGLHFAAAGTQPEELVPVFRSWRVPLLAQFAARDGKKLRGGRPVVQDSDIDEIFVRPDPHADMVFKPGWSLFGVEEGQVDVTAVKCARERDGLVVRLYVPGESAQRVVLRVDGRLARAQLLSLDERKVLKTLPAERGLISFTLPGKKIATVFLSAATDRP